MKKVISIFLAFSMLLCMAPVALAASSEAEDAANKLYAEGLFIGTGTDSDGNPIFELDRAPTRHEAITMLVRLLGKEEEAKNGPWNIPFTDVAEWAKPYVGYAYTNGLTSGTSGSTYSGEQTVTVSQYITFVLRSLGYEDGVDFQWNKAWELSDKIGLTHGEYDAKTTQFTRGDVAIISYNSLSVDANVAVTGISLNKTSLSLTIGKSEILTATVTPDNATNKNISWSSSNPSVASVSNGVVTAVAAGTATITAKCGSRTASCAVNVAAPQKAPVSWYPESSYRVGMDIPAGDYCAIQTANYPGYYCIYNNTSKSDIIDNDNFNNQAFFRVENGQYLSLSRCKIASANALMEPIVNPDKEGYYPEGEYRVGIDIQEGEYQFVQDATYPGYYCAYHDISKGDIVSNDNFNGTAYYQVTSGQLLSVSRAKFKRTSL